MTTTEKKNTRTESKATKTTSATKKKSTAKKGKTAKKTTAKNRNLVLVESPAKARTINKYLGRKFVVEPTVGHIKNLPKAKLGVDVDNDFQAQYVTIRGKGDILKKIRQLSTKSDKVFIATDPDREGEAIAQDIADVVMKERDGDVFRVLFNEITKKGVLRGMDNPRIIDNHLVASQRARRVMDRIIGYKISPFLWKAAIEEADNNLSAGRVQSVALRLICEREEIIDAFIPTEYWVIKGKFESKQQKDVGSFTAKLHSVDEKDIKILPKPDMTDEERKEFDEKYFAVTDEKIAAEIYKEIKEAGSYVISDITKKQSKKYPSPPFITSSLQAEASRVLRMRPRQTMAVAQKLYEGIEMGNEGTVGLITYMRTDSTRVSTDIIDEARTFIGNEYGKPFLPDTPNFYKQKKESNATVQDAHEAIRPTSLKYTPDFVRKYLDDNAFKLYQLVWRRFVASQMTPASVETTTLDVKAGERYLFKASGQAILFQGFMKVYIEDEKDDNEENSVVRDEIIPSGLKKDELLALLKLTKQQSFTKPLPRFTESSLIKELESNGIGRPSTYSLIVSTILDRNYVNQKERKLLPTELGKKVNQLLVDNFSEFFDVNFTAEMESELDGIAQGELEYTNVLRNFYVPFAKTLEEVEDKLEKILCEKCGNEMIIKVGRFGKFLACSNYPECKNIKPLKDIAQEKKEPEYTGEQCEKCGARTVFRYGKFGRFIGCEKYPDCDFVKNIDFGVGCPKCKKGKIVERQSRRGKVFYGCSTFPDCDFVSWYKPVPKSCPECGSTYLEERYTKSKGKHYKCPNCKYQTEVTEEKSDVEKS